MKFTINIFIDFEFFLFNNDRYLNKIVYIRDFEKL